MSTATQAATKWCGLTIKWPVTLDEDRFRKLISKHCIETSEAGNCVPVAVLFELLRFIQCLNPSCSNDARYSSGLCAICDLTINGGEGTRDSNRMPKTPLLGCRVCGDTLTTKWGGHCFNCLSQG